MDKNKERMEKYIESLLRNWDRANGKPADELAQEICALFDVSKCYTEKDMDNAYDKGFNDGNQRDLTGSLIEVL